MTATAPEGFHTLAQDLYARVDSAQRSMTTARTVPAEVALLIDDVADQLDRQLLPTGLDSVDPYLGQALFAAALAGEKGLRAADEEQRRQRVRLALERMRQALRDLVDEAPTHETVAAKSVAQWLDHVVSVPQAELAALLGVSPRTWQRWVSDAGRGPEGDDEARVRGVARVVAHLRHVFTGPGVLRWFERPHPELTGEPPKSLLADPLAVPELVRLASRTRSTMAT